MIILICIIIPIFLFIKGTSTNRKMVYVPLSKQEWASMTLQDVEKRFKDAGFTNIDKKSETNNGLLGLGWFKKDAFIVKEVEIDGDKNVAKNKQFDSKVKVIIYYYEEK